MIKNKNPKTVVAALLYDAFIQTCYCYIILLLY